MVPGRMADKTAGQAVVCGDKQDYWNTNGRDLFRECLLEGIEIALTEKQIKYIKRYIFFVQHL